jgi:hypothetical protein
MAVTTPLILPPRDFYALIFGLSMLKTVKILFDWTPSDITAWERIRQKGLPRFMLWYGLAFSGIMFLVMGTVGLKSIFTEKLRNLARYNENFGLRLVQRGSLWYHPPAQKPAKEGWLRVI